MISLLEKDVVKSFRALILSLYPDSFDQKIHQDNVAGSGFPDLIFVIEGEVLFLEAKRLGQKPSPKQEVVLTLLSTAGATAGVLEGGVDKKTFTLIPWNAPEEKVILDLQVRSADKLRTQIKEFIDACRRNGPRVD